LVRGKRNIFFTVLAIFIFSFFIFFFLNQKYWVSKGKMFLVSMEKEGSVTVSVFDVSGERVTNINFPADTQVSSARQYGSWKFKNLEKLAEDEGVGGKLIAETLRYDFSLPVFIWAKGAGFGFGSDNFVSKLKASLSFYKTNLSFYDKIRLGLFSFGISGFERENIDLSQNYLRKQKLIDGTYGYVGVGDMPAYIYALFADTDFSQNPVRVKVVSKSARDIDNRVVKVIEVMGAKVASIEDIESENLDCTVYGDKDFARKLADVFGCEKIKPPKEGFDLEFEYGEDFAKRF